VQDEIADAQWTIDGAPHFVWISFACLASAFAIVRPRP
jgi:hypothetical protein